MLHQIKTYINFLYNSTNHHGVHSPFVFSLITKCLYSSTNQKITNSIPFKTKKHKTIHRLLHYFNEANPQLISFQKDTINTSNKVIYIDINYCLLESISIQDILSKATNDTCFIFNHIHKTPSNSNFWKSIVQNPNFTATIDTFQLGITFIRKEQEKEHFVIRV